MLIYKDIKKRLLYCDHREQNKQETKLETINPEQGCFSLWAAVLIGDNKIMGGCCCGRLLYTVLIALCELETMRKEQ